MEQAKEMMDIKKILQAHKCWLNQTCDGWQDMRANLRDANLKKADLQGADLRYADLQDANLRYTDLRYAVLQGADLRNADLRYAKLQGANLQGADLRNADLRYADLQDADLRNADLRYAKLQGANLQGADYYIPYACPDTGAFIGWKKVDGHIIKLLIPEEAKRCSATTSMCRCEFAEVLDIENCGTGEKVEEITNKNFAICKYKVGDIVYPDSYDTNRWNECSHGIHFFINRTEAERY